MSRFDEPVTETVVQRAVDRGGRRQPAPLHASAVRYMPEVQALMIKFADQSAVVLPIRNYPELAGLTPDELDRLVLGFAGGALCLEEHDLHVSIAGLVSASAPLMELAVTVAASRSGRQSSAIKAAASRENGRKGGRPRKVVATG